MSYKELMQIYNNRREKLQSLMNDDSVNLEENRLLQIKGAIEEISMFLSVLEQYHQKNVENNIRKINDIEGNIREGVFSKVKSSVFG